jgi:hypothetical protein
VPRSSVRARIPWGAEDDHPDWTELWEACVALLDRYPHLRPPAAPPSPGPQHVQIPQAAVDASDLHVHLD